MNIEIIRMLAKEERDMDEGKQEFVVYDNTRVAVSKRTMELLMLKTGQSISNIIFKAILESHIKECKDKIKERNNGC